MRKDLARSSLSDRSRLLDTDSCDSCLPRSDSAPATASATTVPGSIRSGRAPTRVFALLSGIAPHPRPPRQRAVPSDVPKNRGAASGVLASRAMTRRGIGALGCALGLAGALVGCGKPPTPPPPPLRGLLLITVDTLRADHVGAYGGPVPTPAMDRLAREGALVEQAVTPSPTTAPAHASLFTGVYPGATASSRRGPPGDRSPPSPSAFGRGASRPPPSSPATSSTRFGFSAWLRPLRLLAPRVLLRGCSERFNRAARLDATAMTWLTQQLSPARALLCVGPLFDPTPY